MRVQMPHIADKQWRNTDLPETQVARLEVLVI